MSLRVLEQHRRKYREPTSGELDLGDGTFLQIFDEQRESRTGPCLARVWDRWSKGLNRRWTVVYRVDTLDQKNPTKLGEYDGPLNGMPGASNPDKKVHYAIGKVPEFAKYGLGENVAEKFSTVKDFDAHLESRNLFVPTKEELRNSIPGYVEKRQTHGKFETAVGSVEVKGYDCGGETFATERFQR